MESGRPGTGRSRNLPGIQGVWPIFFRKIPTFSSDKIWQIRIFVVLILLYFSPRHYLTGGAVMTEFQKTMSELNEKVRNERRALAKDKGDVKVGDVTVAQV